MLWEKSRTERMSKLAGMSRGSRWRMPVKQGWRQQRGEPTQEQREGEREDYGVGNVLPPGVLPNRITKWDREVAEIIMREDKPKL